MQQLLNLRVALIALGLGCSGPRFSAQPLAESASDSAEPEQILHGSTSALTPGASEAHPSLGGTQPALGDPALGNPALSNREPASSDAPASEGDTPSRQEPAHNDPDAGSTHDPLVVSPTEPSTRGSSVTALSAALPPSSGASASALSHSSEPALASTTPSASAAQPEASTTTSPEPATSVTSEPSKAPNHCEPPFVASQHGVCYFVNSDKLAWTAARNACLDLGAAWDLATIRNQTEHDTALQLVKVDTWIGAKAADELTTWSWVGDSKPFFIVSPNGSHPVDDAFTAWAEAPRKESGAPQGCARYREDDGPRGWADFPCPQKLASLCERR